MGQTVKQTDDTGVSSFLKQRTRENCIDLASARQAAKHFSYSLRQVERIGLSHGILPLRYHRNGLSCRKQLKLLDSTVSVIGCGGLGGRCAELLARLGIGRIVLTDPDHFSESNLNRQLFCNINTLGCSKADTVANELQAINPELETVCHVKCFDRGSVQNADIVIDALDSIPARKELSTLCRTCSIPMVHGAVKNWYGRVGIDFSTNHLTNTTLKQPNASTPPPDVLPMTVSLVASLQVAETCKFILNTGTPLNWGWLQCDLLHTDFESINIEDS